MNKTAVLDCLLAAIESLRRGDSKLCSDRLFRFRQTHLNYNPRGDFHIVEVERVVSACVVSFVGLFVQRGSKIFRSQGESRPTSLPRISIAVPVYVVVELVEDALVILQAVEVLARIHLNDRVCSPSIVHSSLPLFL